MTETLLVILVQLQTLTDVAESGGEQQDEEYLRNANGKRDSCRNALFDAGFWQHISQINSLEGLVVFSLAVVEQTELQESGAVVVAQPRGWRQILDGLLRVAHSHVTLCAELPRFGIPGGNLEAHSNLN